MVFLCGERVREGKQEERYPKLHMVFVVLLVVGERKVRMILRVFMSVAAV